VGFPARHCDRGRAALEVLGRVATVAVDKTGTLTDNRLAVIGVATGVGVARERVLGVAAAWRSVVGIRWPVPASRGCVGGCCVAGLGVSRGDGDGSSACCCCCA